VRIVRGTISSSTPHLKAFGGVRIVRGTISSSTPHLKAVGGVVRRHNEHEDEYQSHGPTAATFNVDKSTNSSLRNASAEMPPPVPPKPGRTQSMGTAATGSSRETTTSGTGESGRSGIVSSPPPGVGNGSSTSSSSTIPSVPQQADSLLRESIPSSSKSSSESSTSCYAVTPALTQSHRAASGEKKKVVDNGEKVVSDVNSNDIKLEKCALADPMDTVKFSNARNSGSVNNNLEPILNIPSKSKPSISEDHLTTQIRESEVPERSTSSVKAQDAADGEAPGRSTSFVKAQDVADKKVPTATNPLSENQATEGRSVPETHHSSTIQWPDFPVNVTFKNFSEHILQYAYFEDSRKVVGTLEPNSILPEPIVFKLGTRYTIHLRRGKEYVQTPKTFTYDQDFEISRFFE